MDEILLLHENPELKQAAYVWLTDIVGWVPMPALGKREAELTSDYDAEMIEQVERFPQGYILGLDQKTVGDRQRPAGRQELPLAPRS